jgi:transcriptional regulator with XRE-family HTH domain
LHLLAIASTLVSMVRVHTQKLGEQLGSLGEFIAAQRRTAQLSLRQLADQTGISNPYLSQIERGLRKPSAEVLLQLSKALRVSAETLYVRAGILDPEDHPATSVEMAVLADMAITERQKRVLIDVYTSFVKENEKTATSGKPQNDQVEPNREGERDVRAGTRRRGPQVGP